MSAPGPNDPCWCLSGQKFKRCHKLRSRPLEPGTVSPRREVPDSIPRPDYATSGQPQPRREGSERSDDFVARMRVAGRVAAELLAHVGAAVRPGITTDALDVVAHDECVRLGVYPSPLNYRGFPKAICTSVNEVICHGIPDSRMVEEGDIVNIDVTVFVDGVHGDTNATFGVGTIDAGSQRLIDVTRECLAEGIGVVRPGSPISDIGRAIEAHATAHDLSVIRTFVGHGIGEQFHTDPTIPHYYERTARRVIEPGMTFTIEPMIAMGSPRERIWSDGWTAVTIDGLRTAQFEHTLLVTEDGVEVLTEAP